MRQSARTGCGSGIGMRGQRASMITTWARQGIARREKRVSSRRSMRPPRTKCRHRGDPFKKMRLLYSRVYEEDADRTGGERYGFRGKQYLRFHSEHNRRRGGAALGIQGQGGAAGERRVEMRLHPAVRRTREAL